MKKILMKVIDKAFEYLGIILSFCIQVFLTILILWFCYAFGGPQLGGFMTVIAALHWLGELNSSDNCYCYY